MRSHRLRPEESARRAHSTEPAHHESFTPRKPYRRGGDAYHSFNPDPPAFSQACEPFCHHIHFGPHEYTRQEIFKYMLYLPRSQGPMRRPSRHLLEL